MPTRYELEVILQHCKNAYTRKEVFNILWKRLGDHGKFWQRVHKALIVFEYLIRHGTEAIRDEIRRNQYKMFTSIIDIQVHDHALIHNLVFVFEFLCLKNLRLIDITCRINHL